MHDDVSSYQQKDDLEVSEESAARERVKRALMTSEAVDEAPVASQLTQDIAREIAHRHVEEQEIEEEEAELTSYGEEPGDDEGFEELEEETRAASGEVSQSASGENAPSQVTGLDSASEPVPVGETAVNDEVVPEAVLEAEEREAEELELEEAQAEAEALREAEAIGDGTLDASAEVRGPAPEAMLTQRTQRRAAAGGVSAAVRTGWCRKSASS